MNKPPSSNYATLLTPPGRGAIASISVVGKQGMEAVQVCFASASGKPLDSFPINRILFGRWKQPGSSSPGEEVVVCRKEEHSLEIHCHGGQAASAAILEDLRAMQCASLDWLERPGNDLIDSEARAALAQCTTERTATILLDQFRGALREAIEKIKISLQGEDFGAAQKHLSFLLDRAPLGLRLTQGWKVTLAGPPNGGKSSLMNALVGYRRSLVKAIPGTTRDLLNASTALEGWPVILTDSAGLRGSEDKIELAGMERAKKNMAEADLILLVFDISLPWTEMEQQLLAAHPHALVIYNKDDLPHNLSGRPAAMTMSALQRERIGDLALALASRLVPNEPSPGEPIPFTSRQVSLLQEAKKWLSSKDEKKAISALQALVGFESEK